MGHQDRITTPGWVLCVCRDRRAVKGTYDLAVDYHGDSVVEARRAYRKQYGARYLPKFSKFVLIHPNGDREIKRAS